MEYVKLSMVDKTKIFKALSDSNRLRILNALQQKMLCVCEIKELLDLANSTVSQHLKILKDAGFIIEEKDGRWVNYMIHPNPSDNRIKEILNSLQFWIDDQKNIQNDLEMIDQLDRNIICKP